MRNRKAFNLTLLTLSASFQIVALSVVVFGQADSREKPQLKDFGKSLKRLKWDAKKNQAVEVKDKDDEKSDSDEDVIRVETTLVVSDVLVLDDKERSVQGLTKQDFIVSEDGTPQESSIFSRGDDTSVARSIVLIIDNSSALLAHPNESVEVAKTLVDKLRPNDRMAIVTDDVKLLSNFTHDKIELKNKLESFKKDSSLSWIRDNKSHQYSALMATLRELFDDEDIRPIVIFQADGDELSMMRPFPKDTPQIYKDNPSLFSIKNIYEMVEKSRATIYAVYPGYRLADLPLDTQRKLMEDHVKKVKPIDSMLSYKLGRVPTRNEKSEFVNYFTNDYVGGITREQPVLEKLSALTGGWTEYLQDSSQADEIYTRILTNVDNRYVIGYYPKNTERDGKRRTVKVEVRGHPEYNIVGRKTYLAPED